VENHSGLEPNLRSGSVFRLDEAAAELLPTPGDPPQLVLFP